MALSVWTPIVISAFIPAVRGEQESMFVTTVGQAPYLNHALAWQHSILEAFNFVRWGLSCPAFSFKSMCISNAVCAR
ncbi:hypothetical protein B0H11DRAFT_2015370 [Mycena galericulata]|nr:hypothetical protein B0H11DRAFT_2015370 [Mycena galericulata]